MRLQLLLVIFSVSVIVHGQSKLWTVEAEDVTSKVTWNDGMADIVAPKGLTLWYNREMQGNTVIDYDAEIVSDPRFKDKDGNIRVSDLNCFWMATEDSGLRAEGSGNDSPLQGVKSRAGKFLNSYTMKLYYVGYGGNWNTTTRFRRYDGDVRGVTDAAYRPRILREYTDLAHLLKADHWYHIHLEQIDGRVIYVIDGDTLVDYLDPQPLTKGCFGFRTTLSHARLRNFHYSCTDPDKEPVVLRWIGTSPSGDKSGDTPVTFGVPFSQGEKTDDSFILKTDKGITIPFDTWRLASWSDGSAKWQAFAAVIPAGTDSCLLYKSSKATVSRKSGRSCENGNFPSFTITLNNRPCEPRKMTLEQQGKVRSTVRIDYDNSIVRMYMYNGSRQVKIVHTLLVDSALNKEGLHELSFHFKVPMRPNLWDRYVQFDDKRLSVQPLIARRKINLAEMDPVTEDMLSSIAKWDGFRLSQLSPNGYSIRKRATSESPWIGTIEGHRSNGLVTVGDSVSATSIRLEDFWQSYPSTIQVDNVCSYYAKVKISLYSPEAEPYSFAHYDTIPHTLEAAYEDVQPGMSTAFGIARTSTILFKKTYNGDGDSSVPATYYLLPTPEYLHRKCAFGIWALPTIKNKRDSLIETTISGIMDMYEREIERNGWYGFFNYGDVMHSYDDTRGEWRYDVGGYAWDNTELGSPAMFWYQFLRTGDPDVWRMATAMTRHCSEVDTYHLGPHAGLGSRHNVIHWGDGAKEARISEAWWNRFMYCLTADERLGDIMHEVADADTLLYHLDPMRLAQPRSKYPCTAPARLRLGPDWFAYASNWFTEIERSPTELNTPETQKLSNKLFAGMNSIAGFPHGFFEGPKALGYDPATGIITNECDSTVQNTNHLMTIMGGFELMNELEKYYSSSKFFDTWLEFCRTYKQNAWKISKNKFRIPRLQAYAAWRLGDSKLADDAWRDLLGHIPAYQLNQPISTDPSSTQSGAVTQPRTSVTNDCATWLLDAIFIKEVLRY